MAPGIHPGAAESCDGVDQNCNTLIDEGALVTWFRDDDRDGWGQSAATVEACAAPAGFVDVAGDCADRNPAIHPEAEELCNALDDDCDSVADDGVAVSDSYPDRDGDGFPAQGAAPQASCLVPDGFVRAVDHDGDGAVDWDCDDSLALTFPGAAERCNASDDDCDQLVDEIDVDGDGYYGCALVANRDCDDGDGAIHPGAAEGCDGVDQDCDGRVDEDVEVTWYRDNDGDGYGQDAATRTSCVAPSGYVAAGGDCVDYNVAIHPGAAEACNGADDDCNGVADDDLPILDLYPDTDGDGVPPETENVQNDCRVPLGFTVQVDLDGDGEPDWDCDDLDAGALPGGVERCNGADDDCDLLVDEVDADGDGFYGCLTAARRDCDDGDADVSPGEVETCDGRDQNCDGLIDEGVLVTFYRDNDADGFGLDAAAVTACEAPVGYAARAGDCVDFNAGIHPGAAEACNDADDDCNGLLDDGLTLLDIYPDLDGDGFAASAVNVRHKCDVPLGFAVSRDANGNGAPDWDCDDLDTLSYPGAPERCGDGVDNGCTGVADRLCFSECEGSWPYIMTSTTGTSDAQIADLNGDGESEIIVQNSFGFAILDFTGEVLYEYSAPVHNYSRGRVVLADVDDYDRFTAGVQTLEVLTGNGSRPHIYRLNADRTVSEFVDAADEVYDASRFMARDLDGDGKPELLTTTWCRTNSTEFYRYDRGTTAITKVAGIVEPNAVCEYTHGRMLTDLDGDGTLELMISSGWGDGTQPRYWSGTLYAYRFVDPAALTFTPYCTGCFDTAVAGLYGGATNELTRVGDEIRSQIVYFSANVPNANNPSTNRFWRHSTAGATQPGYPTSAATIWADTTDLDRDGARESISDVVYGGLYDLNGDGLPDRVTGSGTQLRVGLYNATSRAFVDHAPSAITVSTSNVAARALWDIDDDGRMDVITADASGRVSCYELGPSSFDRAGVVPPHYTLAYRTYQWDNYEPNEGADTTGDGIPDQVARIPSALTSTGDFYAYFSSLADKDYYLLDTAYGASMCVTVPTGVTFRMKVYSYLDRWNNATHAPAADGAVDGLVWESGDATGTRCFAASTVVPARNGEYKFVLGVEPVAGPADPTWPYWITAPK
ncbi:MAG TPA: MopE-related protein [Myxococcota bacterium]|nr:MopE-related protein [Myxococcota bacterium]